MSSTPSADRPMPVDPLLSTAAPPAPEGDYLKQRPNLRCLGGIPAGDGRMVRRARFLRAPALTSLDAGETQALAALDPAVVVDFRGVAESQENPVALPEPLAARRVALSIEPSAKGRFEALFGRGEPSHDDVAAAMQETYRDYVRVHIEVYARFLRLARDAGDSPVMFHCTAGKDRTGFAAALLLTALGASREAVLRDYLATNGRWRPLPDLEARMPISARAAVFSVHATYLDAALAELDRAHGGAAAFVRDAMGGDAALDGWRRRHVA